MSLPFGMLLAMAAQSSAGAEGDLPAVADRTEQAVLLLEIHDGDLAAQGAMRIDSDLVAMALQTRLPKAHVLTQAERGLAAWRLVLTRQTTEDSVELRLDSPAGRPVAIERVPLPVTSPAVTARMLALLAIGMLSPIVPGLAGDTPTREPPLAPTPEPALSPSVSPALLASDVSLAGTWYTTLPTLGAAPGLELAARLWRGSGFVVADLGTDLRTFVERHDDVRLRIKTARASLGGGWLLVAHPARWWLAAAIAVRRSSVQASGAALTLSRASYWNPGVALRTGVEVPLTGAYVGVSLTYARFFWWQRFTVAGTKIGNLGPTTVGGTLYFGIPWPQ